MLVKSQKMTQGRIVSIMLLIRCTVQIKRKNYYGKYGSRSIDETAYFNSDLVGKIGGGANALGAASKAFIDIGDIKQKKRGQR